MALDSIKARIPQWLLGAGANCGGSNRRLPRFAANLLRDDLTDAEVEGICHSLIFPGGIRMTSAPGRNRELLEGLLDQGIITLPPQVRVMDVGSSLGLDALGVAEALSRRTTVRSFLLADRHTELLFDGERGLIFDQDGHLLQVAGRSGFVSVHFAYNYLFQRITNLPKRLSPWWLKKKYRFDAARPLQPIPLLAPAVRRSGFPFEHRRVDVFQPLHETADLIICMHLLVPRYFSAEQIERGRRNLQEALNIGGSLVTGATEDCVVITRLSEREYRRQQVSDSTSAAAPRTSS